MEKNRRQMIVAICAGIFMTLALSTAFCWAESETEAYSFDTSIQKKDEGYAQNKKTKKTDLHHGWELGKFQISGFTEKDVENPDNPVFYKNAGDEIKLTFTLNQDILALNGNDKLVIAQDNDGFDEYFGIKEDAKTDFGLGTLLVKKTDSNNNKSYIGPYTNFLDGVKKNATTDIVLYEEGDYEIALDYEVQNKKSWLIPDDHENYQAIIKFSIRNSNCMFFAFDVETGSELFNNSFTENGFYIDLANSKYLKVSVKKEEYVEANGGRELDVRFNKSASDGEIFTETGVYTVTVEDSIGKKTEKTIYIGSDPIIKAHFISQKDIDSIINEVENGATIDDDGHLQLGEIIAPEKVDDASERDYKQLTVIVSLIVAAIIAYAFTRQRRIKRNIEITSEYNGEDDI